MGSRREEERNEKIIRGLMKLPPNRRCINCNSLGPQYVCTNFWTFVCMTCSGIHREFTHRVKSVSMSKFTSQEVDALQNGGNQRAREIYLKGWDHQGQRLPDNSNVDKVREFIKNVYIEKKYVAVNTHNKPPRDSQTMRSLEDETRRASSYHSYSQSPPYDFQYEDRCYGKQGAMLTRKPGSDRGIYVNKTSSFAGSPTRFTDEGSVSSGGEPVRSGRESPSFQKDNGFSSPVQSSRDSFVENPALNLFSEANFKRDTGSVRGPQRTMSSGSIGNVSVKSSDSGSLAGVVSGPEENTLSYHDKIVSMPHSSASVTNGTLEAPVVSAPQVNAASSIDLFQLPGAPAAPSVDLFHESPLESDSSTNLCPPSHMAFPSSTDLFAKGVGQQFAFTLHEKEPEPSVPMNGGWANFDSPQGSVTSERHEDHTHAVPPPGVGSSMDFEKALSQSANMQWPPLQTSSAQGSLLVSDPWKEGFQNVPAPINPVNAQVWKAFDDNSIMPLPAEGIKPNSESQSAAGPLSKSATGPLLQSATGTLSTFDQHVGLRVGEDSNDYAFQRTALYEGYAAPTGNSDFALGPTFMFPVMEDSLQNAISNRTTNPFDLPYDSDLEPAHMFLDMSSLQAALPNSQLPPTFLGGVGQQWFPSDTAANYIPAAPQGGLAYMAGEALTSQYPNLQTQGHVASIGGNPFA